MIERNDDVGPGLVQVFEALHLDPEQRAIDDRERVAERARRHGAPDRDSHQQAPGAEQEKQRGRGQARDLQERDQDRAAGHEGGVEHVHSGHYARPAIGTGPGLHGGEDRNDIEPAGNGEPGKVDGNAQSARRAENGRDPLTLRGGQAPGGPAEVNREQAEQDGAQQGRQQNDASGREPSRKPRADRDRNREDRETDRDHLLDAAKRVLDQRRKQRQRDRADQPEPAGDESAPPDAPVSAQILQQLPSRDENVLAHDEIGRPLAGRRDHEARAPA